MADVTNTDKSVEVVLMSLARCLNAALDAMNEAVVLTSRDGPAAGMEYIADYLNGSDGVDPERQVPNDWLTQWTVLRRDAD